MKTRRLFLLAILLVSATITDAATINWANPAGGDWSVAGNWDPNQVPGPDDFANIPQGVPVTISTSVTVFRMDLGNNGTLVFDVNSSLTVQPTGVLNLGGADFDGNHMFYGAVTNRGIIRWGWGQWLISDVAPHAAGSLHNEAGGVIEIGSDQHLGYFQDMGNFYNAGTIRKTGGIGITRIEIPLTNIGTVEALSGTIELHRPTLSPEGTIAIALSEPGQPARLAFPGESTTLAGTFRATTMGGYHPRAGDRITALTLRERLGEFSSMDLPSTAAWESIYGPNDLVLLVKNGRPIIAGVADQAMNALTTLNLALSATDADIPANHLTFSLASGPVRMTVSPSGALSWTPTEAQGAAAYPVTVTVTDNGVPALSATTGFTVVVHAAAGRAELIAQWDFEGDYRTSNGNAAYDLIPGGHVDIVHSVRGRVAEFHGGTFPITDQATLSHPDLDRLDTLATPDNASFNGGFSIMGWALSRTTSSPNVVLSHDSSAGPGLDRMGFALYFFDDGPEVILGLRDNSDRRLWAEATSSLMWTNRWHHIAATWDGSVAGGISIYVDGIPLPPTLHFLGSFGGLTGPASLPIRLGAHLGNSIQELKAFDGFLDHFSLYHGVLTPAEVEADFLATRHQLARPTLNVRVSQVELCWDTVPSQLYQLQYRSVVTGDAWVPLGDWFHGTGSPFCTNDTVSSGAPQRFYQLITTNAP